MDIVELGQVFRTARVEHRLTQQDVSNRAGVSVPTVSRFERGDLLEMGVVKLLTLLNLVGLELYPRPLGQTRTLDDIQRERMIDATPRGLRAAISHGTEVHNGPWEETRTQGLRAGQNSLIEKNSPLPRRVRHSKKDKKNG